jgi:hypothetical protein
MLSKRSEDQSRRSAFEKSTSYKIGIGVNAFQMAIPPSSFLEIDTPPLGTPLILVNVP